MVIFLIERYEIVKDGNEEILIIYLNYKYEFSKDFMNFENDNNLKEKIKTIQPNIPLDYYQLVDFVQWLEKLLKTKIIKK